MFKLRGYLTKEEKMKRQLKRISDLNAKADREEFAASLRKDEADAKARIAKARSVGRGPSNLETKAKSIASNKTLRNVGKAFDNFFYGPVPQKKKKKGKKQQSFW